MEIQYEILWASRDPDHVLDEGGDLLGAEKGNLDRCRMALTYQLIEKLGTVRDRIQDRVVIHPDDMFLAITEYLEIIGGFTIDHDLLDLVFQDHAGHTLVSVLKSTLARFDGFDVLYKGIGSIVHGKPLS